MLEFLNEKLIFINRHYKDRDALFEDIGGEITTKGFGTGQFVKKLKEREVLFPTGLNLKNYGVAIPHTDSDYVAKQFISVTTLKEPVMFRSMENMTVEVPVSLVFILGLKKAESQLQVLQKLMQVIQNEELVNNLIHNQTIDTIVATIKNAPENGRK